MASGNGSGNRDARPYRRHRPLPALIVIGVLALGAVVVWVNAVVGRGDVDEAVRCTPDPAPQPGAVFTSVPHNGLDDRSPIPPDKVTLKVLNASTTRGQGGIATSALRELGFTGIGDPGNDPAYPKGDAQCRGQIRYGDNGAAAARTVSLVAPCAELVHDNRRDASVDLATGKLFTDIQPRAEARTVLKQLSDWSHAHQGSGGGSEQSSGSGAPTVDQTLLAAARDVTC
ncbi:LytR cell envelope-related transcriptional attenuator [Amycolatopsis sulphurea]|uniref:LytR cell envelope-related transcriptional attenuator n=1 Tax=Amycolatopsis sulphurea TaxID=76022 RepID=A0A2A9G1A8_9PSEU|nr:envelope integrity protein Cei [Amycolatopsis sulphurea]PFG56525.1 LytR cell envelope-related transcriptional attenuator [Amycolatopsis sulphurea]